MKPTMKTLFGAALSAASTLAVAAALDGSAPLLCAVTETVSCDAQGECVEGPAEAVNLPVFLKIDVQNKVAQSVRASSEQRTSESLSTHTRKVARWCCSASTRGPVGALGVSMLLYAMQSLILMQSEGTVILFGLAPLHALAIGFFDSMVLGMTSRVTLGHSGRPLVLDNFTWLLFIDFQATALLRIIADIVPAATQHAPQLYLMAGMIWLACFILWVQRVFSTASDRPDCASCAMS